MYTDDPRVWVSLLGVKGHRIHTAVVTGSSLALPELLSFLLIFQMCFHNEHIITGTLKNSLGYFFEKSKEFHVISGVPVLKSSLVLSEMETTHRYVILSYKTLSRKRRDGRPQVCAASIPGSWWSWFCPVLWGLDSPWKVGLVKGGCHFVSGWLFFPWPEGAQDPGSEITWSHVSQPSTRKRAELVCSVIDSLTAFLPLFVFLSS